MTFFSIIVPCFNSAKFIQPALTSLIRQTVDIDDFEVIFIDDASTDETISIIREFQESVSFETKLIPCNSSQGPGICRNLGIHQSSGQYLLFLDSDDCLAPCCLSVLKDTILSEGYLPDIVPYDYYITPSLEPIYLSSNSTLLRKRRDFNYFTSKSGLIISYLEMKMDSSVIFTSFRRKFLLDNNLLFPSGIYEDITFLFKTYCLHESLCLVKKHLYYKLERPGSIVMSFSSNHIDLYLHAWFNIYQFIRRSLRSSSNLSEKSLIRSYIVGLRGAIGVLIDMHQNHAQTISLSRSDTIALILKNLKDQPEILGYLCALDERILVSRYDQLYLQVHHSLLQ